MSGNSVVEVRSLSFSGSVTSGHARTLRPPSRFRKIRRAFGGFAAYLFSWWRY